MQQRLSRSLFQRHSSRCAWVYLLWVLLAYLPLATLVIIVNESRWLICLLSVPVVLAILQMVQPTFCGWLIISVPTIFYSGYWVLHLVYMLFKTRLRGFWDAQDFVGASIMCGAEVLVGVALIYVRPKFNTLTRVA